MKSRRKGERISRNASAIAFVLLSIALLSSVASAYQDFLAMFPETGEVVFVWPYNAALFATVFGIGAGWFVCVQNQRVTKSFRHLVRFCLLAAIVLVGIQNPIFGVWSIASALAFACFWFLVERMPTSNSSWTPFVTAIFGFLLVSSFVYAGVSEKQRRVADRSLRQKHRMAALESKQLDEQKDSVSAETLADGIDSNDSVEDGAQESTAPQLTADGREQYRLGIVDAELHLDVFIDYGSTLSLQFQQEAESIVAKHPDYTSVAFHHFPMCIDCNPSVQQTTNPNACRAAKVAEAARSLYGLDGFRTMHKWLLARGDFSDEELRIAVSELGEKTWDEFVEVMESKKVLSSILSDVVQARTLKVKRAPTVLLNRRYVSPDGIARLVTEVIEEAALEEEFHRKEVWGAALAKEFPPAPQTKALLHTVRIVNPIDESQGSGVILSTKPPFIYVLTADHVVVDADSTLIETFTTDTFPEPSQSFRGSVVARSEVEDLAVIRFSASDFPSTTIPLAAANYPTAEVTGASAGCEVGEAPSSVADGAKRELIQRGENTKTIQMWVYNDTPSKPGRSGGPLIDESGSIIGICSGVSSGKAHFCHSDEIHRFLDENGLASLAGTDPKQNLDPATAN